MRQAWCMERDALDLCARHYQTGEPIPEEEQTELANIETLILSLLKTSR